MCKVMIVLVRLYHKKEGKNKSSTAKGNQSDFSKPEKNKKEAISLCLDFLHQR